MSIDLTTLTSLRDKPAHIIGAASAEGVAVLRLLVKLGFSNIVLHDMRPRAELRRSFRTTHTSFDRRAQDELWETLRPWFDVGKYESEYLDGLEDAALVSLGQGWKLDPANRSAVEAALPHGAVVTSMTALYVALSQGLVCGITGTNGKSTTLGLVDHLLTHAGVAHRTAGNDRATQQFLHELPELGDDVPVILETSNRQLDQLDDTVRYNVAAITSLTPDHLEEHDGFDGYRAVKQRIFSGQQMDDVCVWCDNDPECLSIVEASGAGMFIATGIDVDTKRPSRVSWVDGVLEVVGVPNIDNGLVARRADLQMLGDHNMRNAAVAIACALSLGAPRDSIAEGLRTFAGKSLRLEQIESIGSVRVYSDLKSTTPEATLAALSALPDDDLVLVAGGDDKGLNYAPLAQMIAERSIKTVLVPGSATDALERELSSVNAAAKRVSTVELALEWALEHVPAQGAIMVSPAAAGFWSSQLQGKTPLRSLVKQLAARQEVHTS